MWTAATFALVAGYVPCLIVVVRADIVSALAALILGSSLATLALITLTESLQSQSFIDLAVVLVPVSLAGSLAFIRHLERHR